MRTSRRGFVGGVSALALASGSTSAFAQKKYDDGVTDTEIKIGNTNPYSGPASAMPDRQDDRRLLQGVNEAGGINGRKIKFLSLDDGYSPPKTVEIVRQLVEQDKIFALFQPLGTPCNTAIHKYMNQKKVPQLFVATGASKWGDPKNFPWTMGFQPDYHTEGVIYAKHILANVKDAKIAVLHQNDDYGRDYLGGFKEGLGKEAGRIVKVVTYEATDPTVDSQIIQLKDSGANVFFNVTAPKASAQAIRKAADIDWKPAHYLNNISASVAAVMKPAGFDNAQGIITAAYIMDATDKAWDDNAEMKACGGWMQEHAIGQQGRPQSRLWLCRGGADDRDAEALRQRYDARRPDEAGGELPEVPRAAPAAGHHGQHQPDRLLSNPGGPAAALQGRDLGAFRRGHARRKHLSEPTSKGMKAAGLTAAFSFGASALQH